MSTPLKVLGLMLFFGVFWVAIQVGAIFWVTSNFSKNSDSEVPSPSTSG